MNCEQKTTIKELKSFATKLNTALLNSKIQAGVKLRNSPSSYGGFDYIVDITFFKGGKNFTMNMYSFWDIHKNEAVEKMAKKLMRDSDKFEEVSELWRAEF